jgi:hypothetical protein
MPFNTKSKREDDEEEEVFNNKRARYCPLGIGIPFDVIQWFEEKFGRICGGTLVMALNRMSDELRGSQVRRVLAPIFIAADFGQEETNCQLPWPVHNWFTYVFEPSLGIDLMMALNRLAERKGLDLIGMLPNLFLNEEEDEDEEDDVTVPSGCSACRDGLGNFEAHEGGCWHTTDD